MSNVVLAAAALVASNPAAAFVATGVGDLQRCWARITNNGANGASLAPAAGVAATTWAIPAGRTAVCGPFTGRTLIENGLFAAPDSACVVELVRHMPRVLQNTEGPVELRVQQGGIDDDWSFALVPISETGESMWDAAGAEAANVIEVSLQTDDELQGEFEIEVVDLNNLAADGVYTGDVTTGTALLGDSTSRLVAETDADGALVLDITDVVGASGASAFVRATRLDRFAPVIQVECAFD